jgi:hypothetical protein
MVCRCWVRRSLAGSRNAMRVALRSRPDWSGTNGGSIIPCPRWAVALPALEISCAICPYGETTSMSGFRSITGCGRCLYWGALSCWGSRTRAPYNASVYRPAPVTCNCILGRWPDHLDRGKSHLPGSARPAVNCRQMRRPVRVVLW